MGITREAIDRQGIRELSDEEILFKFGDLFEAADRAFRSDPLYMVDMAEAWAQINANRTRRASTDEEHTPEPEPQEPEPKPTARTIYGKAIHPPEVVARVLQLRADGMTIQEIGDRVGLGKEQARGIVRFHSPGDGTGRVKSSKWAARDARIWRLHTEKGLQHKQIAAMVGTSRPTVTRIINKLQAAKEADADTSS